MEERTKYCRSFRMYLNSKNYLFKRNRYSFRSTYMNPMVTTNQKTYNRSTKTRRKEYKHTTKENHITTREETKRRRQEQERSTKTTRK